MGRKLFILAGEASGDLHGARLAAELSDAELFGVPGPRMREAGVETIIPMEEFQIMGFVDVLKSIGRIKKQLKTVQEAIFERNPDAVVMIDYPGFNMRLAKELREKGYQGKLIHYISPKVWAWRKGRIKQLAKTLDLLLLIFPFEVDVYKGSGLHVEYVGNPLTESDYDYDPDWKAKQGFDPKKPLLAIFPGSRRSEVELNLSRQLETARLLQKEMPDLEIAISIANEQVRPLIQNRNKEFATVEPDDSYNLMNNARASLAVSGTVTLEIALHEVPTVVVYRLTWLNAFLAGCIFFIHLPFYSLTNIVAQKAVYPELMHHKFTPKKAAKKLLPFLRETPERAYCIADCHKLHEVLRSERPSQKAAEWIHRLTNP